MIRGGVHTKPGEIVIPGVRLPVTEELLHDTVKDTYRYIQGMFALQQQFYFYALNAFQNITKTDDGSMIRIIVTHPHQEELDKRLSLSGVTKLDIVLNPGTVEVRYPKYDARWEYRDADMYNTVCVENPPESPVKILRIEKEGSSPSELLYVKHRECWPMRKWSEVILYPDRDLFERRADVLLQFFGIPKEDFGYVASLPVV